MQVKSEGSSDKRRQQLPSLELLMLTEIRSGRYERKINYGERYAIEMIRGKRGREMSNLKYPSGKKIDLGYAARKYNSSL